MTETPVIDDPLAQAVLRMRRVGEPEAPFAGWLARVDDAVVQLVDTAALTGWPGWHARGEHVLSVHDVARTSDGHEAVMPWCVERVDNFLRRRDSVGAALSVGEVVTIVVSLLRGCGAARGADLSGVWWLTQDGTPTFVCDGGSGGDSIGDAAGSLLERLEESSAVDRTWALTHLAAILRADDDPRDAEAHLFAIAPPEPLVLAPLTPRRAADARRAGTLELVEPEVGDSILGRLLRRHVDAGVGGMVSDALESARRGARRARHRVAGPWLVAAGIAGVIVVGGLAWPATTTPAADARPVASDFSAQPNPDALGTGTPTETGLAEIGPADTAPAETAPDASASDDPVGALEAALDRLDNCTDSACGAELFEDPSASDMPPGAVDLPPADRVVQLLDDLGGVAILSVTGRDGTTPAQLVVLVRTGQGWVIRDVRDVETP